ncbi:CoA transferase [Micromonospora sp. FIMYZ51]|uniref:CaiB/BaiF CoA transferase family protein n=1 Tax=Micromonospora sp. FIMYZ51 TaxID=3051832 RepID=UPI00311EF920
MEAADFYRDARADLAGPLDGVRVLDVTTVWSGPMASCVLADLGADVIRVELPSNRAGQLEPLIPGTGLSWFDQTVNRNKRSVSLDLRTPAGQEVFLALAGTADIVVENFQPGTMARWGIGFDRLHREHPGLILVSISGWGGFGPGARRRGYDPIVQAESGWMALNGAADGPPVKAPTFLADDLAGLHGAIGALAALRHRDATGEGQHVDVAMTDALLFQSNGYLTLAAAGAPPVRRGDETEFLVPSNSYACRDGAVYLVVAFDRQWRALAELVGRPELARAPGFATNRERRARREPVNALLAQWCATRDAAQVLADLDRIGIAAGRVRSLSEVATDEHVRARGMLAATELSDGSVAELTGPVAKFGRTPTGVRRGASVRGEHTDELLAAVGYDDEARAKLRADGVI